MLRVAWKCHSDDAFLETEKVERVNPTSEQPKLGRGIILREMNLTDELTIGQ